MLNHFGSIVNTILVHYHRVMTLKDAQMKLRMDEAMRDRIAEAAKANNRSMNAEIVARLQQTFEAGTSLAPPLLVSNFDDLMTEFMRRYNITMETPVAIKPPPEFADQADDMPVDPSKRRVNTKRKS